MKFGKIMRNTARYSLRSLVQIIFCLSLGMSHVTGSGVGLSGKEFLESIPSILHEVLLTASATAMVIGLVQQITLLSKAQFPTTVDRSAVRFQIGWRVVIAMVLATSIALKIGIYRGLFHLPAPRRIASSFQTLFPECGIYLGMIAVLTNCIGHGRSKPLGPWLYSLLGLLAVVAMLFALGQAHILTYLVYQALAEVEASQPTRFIREGAYPNFEAESYWLFWLSLAAVLMSLLGAGALWFMLNKSHLKRSVQIFGGSVGLALLSLSAVFGYWFLFAGFPTIAPDFAEADWASDRWHWFEAVGIIALVVPMAARRVSRDARQSIHLLADTHTETVLHLTPLVRIALALSAVSYFLGLLYETTIYVNSGLPGLTPTQLYFGLLMEVSLYIPAALSLLSLKFCWRQWKSPPEHQCPIRIVPFCWTTFMLTCATLLLILVLSIPTIFAFCFAYWVGPWAFSIYGYP